MSMFLNSCRGRQAHSAAPVAGGGHPDPGRPPPGRAGRRPRQRGGARRRAGGAGEGARRQGRAEPAAHETQVCAAETAGWGAPSGRARRGRGWARRGWTGRPARGRAEPRRRRTGGRRPQPGSERLRGCEARSRLGWPPGLVPAARRGGGLEYSKGGARPHPEAGRASASLLCSPLPSGSASCPRRDLRARCCRRAQLWRA